jgi:hypothetical protein
VTKSGPESNASPVVSGHVLCDYVASSVEQFSRDVINLVGY